MTLVLSECRESRGFLWAIIKIYNDVQFVTATVESIKRYVEHIVIGDGAYELYFNVYRKHFPKAKVTSTDGSVEVIKQLSGLPDLTFLRVPQRGWLNQVTKMNALLKEIPRDTWFLDINADEMLVGNIPEAFNDIETSNCIAGRLPLVNLGCDIDRLHYFWHPRFWRREKGIHFAGTHWQVRDFAGRMVETDYPIWWTQHAVMVHFKPLKPKTRISPHLEYMSKLKNRGWLEPQREEIKDLKMKVQ